MAETVIHIDPLGVHARLEQLGLEHDPIVDVVRQGYFAFISSTANHPPLYPGFVAWAEMVSALREYLLPKNWNRTDENNYSLVVSPSGAMAIAVATGDVATGLAGATPTTRSPKGPKSVEAICSNQLLLDLVVSMPTPVTESDNRSTDDDEILTWVLLAHRADAEVRCELSLPSAMAEDGRIDTWQERIIIGAVSIDPEPLAITPPPQPDIDINVKRRA